MSPPVLLMPQKGRADDWSTRPLPASPIMDATSAKSGEDDDPTDSERRHQPELNRVKPVEKNAPIENEFEIDPPTDSDEDDATRNRRLSRIMQGVARQVSLDPNDGMEL